MKVRRIALEAFQKVDMGGYSNIILNELLDIYDLNASDRGLLTEILYGALQHKLTIEYRLAPLLKTKLKRWQKQLLIITVYQIDYLERVPNYAAIDEAVEIAKSKNIHSARIINGILRNYVRNNRRDTTNIKSWSTRLSINASMPKWVIEHLLKHYDKDTVERIVHQLNEKPKLYVRVNTSKTTKNNLKELLKKEGIEVNDAPHKDALSVSRGVISSQAFKHGLCSIQDLSSMYVNDVVAPIGHEAVLDACSAPGGKGLHTLEKLTTGYVDFCDVHAHKLKTIQHNLNRLELKANVYCKDATKDHYPNMYDTIIVDAPCSGLGVVRRKPEIKYMKSSQDIEALVNIQLQILNHVKHYLKPGGTLVYATCTIHQMENENVAYTFKKQNSDFEFMDFTIPEMEFKGPYRQILPHEFNTDGFFIAKFRKKDFNDSTTTEKTD